MGHHLRFDLDGRKAARKQHLGCGEGGASDPHAPVLTNLGSVTRIAQELQPSGLTDSFCSDSRTPNARPVPAAQNGGMPSSSRAEILTGIRMTAPIAAGYIPLGIAYGILVMQLGMPWWMAPALSLAAYSGSAELLVITLAASHTPIAVIAVTMLLVNFRHLFYAFSFPLHLVEGKLARLFSMYALVDEAYAITAARPEGWTKPRLLAMQVTYLATWVASGLIGVLAGSFIPAQIQGLDFALTALFITLTLDSIRSLKDIPSVVLAAGSFLIAMLVWPQQRLLLALLLFVASLVVRHVVTERGEES